jgi:phosphate transport system substrate-binding protein
VSSLRRSAFLAWPAAASLLLGGCRFTPPDPNVDDTPTSGRAVILADADARPVIEQEAAAFSVLYADAELDIHYMGENELLHAMLSDTVRCAVTSAAPGGEQQAWFDKRQLSAPVVPIYVDAIAVVVNKESPLERLDLEQVRGILDADSAHAEGASWREDTGGISSLRALFAGSGSGTARTLIDSLHLSGIRASALPDVAGVIAQAARDPHAVGFIPFAAISDLDNPAMRALRDQVKLLPITRSANTPPVLPSQGSIADGRYPLRRTMKMILTEGKSGLGTGFVSFVANHKGQRIILKLGVAPIRVPPRNVEIVPE